MELKVIEQTDDLTRIALIGRLDVTGVQDVEARFHACTSERKKPAIVDMFQVTFITSLGMRMLLAAARALKKVGAKVVLLRPQPLVEEALKTASLDQVLPIVQDLQQALQAARPQ
jgi:anti-sigma B factor antagonist